MVTVSSCQFQAENELRYLLVTISKLSWAESRHFVAVLTRKYKIGHQAEEFKERWQTTVTTDSACFRAQCTTGVQHRTPGTLGALRTPEVLHTPEVIHIEEWSLKTYESTTRENKFRYYSDLTSELIQRYNESSVDSLLSRLKISHPAKVTSAATFNGNQRTIPEVNVHIERSTYKSATMRWEGQSLNSEAIKWSIILRKISHNPLNGGLSIIPEKLWYATSSARHQFFCKSLSPGEEYEVELSALTELPGSSEYLHGPVVTKTFRTDFAKDDLTKLLSMAQMIRKYNFSEEFIPIRWLYRHKPAEYYADIESTHEGLMEVYSKDFNGDPASCINGQLNGLFFSANVYFNDRTPMNLPIFGNKRFLISAKKMFLWAPKLYFADVYCTVSDVHTVTLVSTRPDSAADNFCTQKLIPLDSTENPFLFLRENQAYVSSKIMVELLYTENINIRECIADKECDAKFEMCLRAAGNVRHGGCRKRPCCLECNVEPQDLSVYLTSYLSLAMADEDGD